MKSIIFHTSLLIASIILSFFNIFFLIMVVLVVIIYTIGNTAPNKDVRSIGLKLLPMKKIYTEYGIFYIHLEYGEPGYNDRVYLFKSKLIFCEPVDNFSIGNNSDIKSIIDKINRSLESEYGRALSHKKSKENLKKMIMKDWNGTTSDVINRDKKIDEIL